MGYVGNNPKFDSTILSDLLSTVVTSPPSGYFKRLVRYGKSYLRSALGVETQIGKGEGKNYCLSPSVYLAATASTLGWFASGGTVSNITAALPRESSLSAIQFVSTTTGDYLRYRFKADDVDILKRLQVVFSEIATFGDFKLEVYSGTDAALSGAQLITIQSIYTNASGITNLPTGTTDIITNFDASAAQYYEVRWTALAGSKTLKISDVNISSGISSQAPAVGTFVSGGAGLAFKTGSGNVAFTFTQNKYEYKRNTDSVDINVKATLTSGWTGAGTNLELEIPTGDFQFAANDDTVQGFIAVYDGAAFLTYGIADITVTGNRIRFKPQQQTDAAQTGVLRNQNDYSASVPFTWASGQLIRISIRGMKTTSWAGSSNVNTINPIAQSAIRAGTIMAFAGATTPQGWLDCDGSVYSQTQYPQLFAQISTAWATCTNPLTGAANTAPTAGNFRVPDLRGAFMRGAGGPNVAGVITALAGYQADQLQGHIHNYNVVTGPGNTGGPYQWDITGTQRRDNTTNTTGGIGAGTNNTTGGSTVAASPGMGAPSGDGTNGTPRTGAETRPQNVGIRYIIKIWDESFNSAGLTALPANNGSAAVAPGYPGELKTADSGAPAVYSNFSVYEEVTSVTLTGGLWKVRGTLFQSFNNSTSPQNLQVALSGYASPATTDHVTAINQTVGTPTGTNNNDMMIEVSDLYVRSDGTNLYIGSFTIAGTQILRLKSRISYSGTAPTRKGYIQAVRIS